MEDPVRLARHSEHWAVAVGAVDSTKLQPIGLFGVVRRRLSANMNTGGGGDVRRRSERGNAVVRFEDEDGRIDVLVRGVAAVLPRYGRPVSVEDDDRKIVH